MNKYKLMHAAIILFAFFMVTCKLDAAEQLFPMTVGDMLEYDVKLEGYITGRTFNEKIHMTTGGGGTQTITVDEITKEKYKGLDIYRLRTREHDVVAAELGKPDRVYDELYVNLPEGIRHMSRRDMLASGTPGIWIKLDPPVLRYKANVKPGDEWNAGVNVIDNMRIYSKAKVAPYETLMLASGTFKDCIKIVYTSSKVEGTTDFNNKEMKVEVGNAKEIVWIAKDIGIVKSESILDLKVYGYLAEINDNARVILHKTLTFELKPGYYIQGAPTSNMKQN
ncbi:MAG: hypothetical protein ACYC27_10180 [Armatimonadota bacterium]